MGEETSDVTSTETMNGQHSSSKEANRGMWYLCIDIGALPWRHDGKILEDFDKILDIWGGKFWCSL